MSLLLETGDLKAGLRGDHGPLACFRLCFREQVNSELVLYWP